MDKIRGAQLAQGHERLCATVDDSLEFLFDESEVDSQRLLARLMPLGRKWCAKEETNSGTAGESMMA